MQNYKIINFFGKNKNNVVNFRSIFTPQKRSAIRLCEGAVAQTNGTHVGRGEGKQINNWRVRRVSQLRLAR
jgi:hypothetical protein